MAESVPKLPMAILVVYLAGTALTGTVGGPSSEVYPFSLFPMFSGTAPAEAVWYEVHVALDDGTVVAFDQESYWHADHAMRHSDAQKLSARLGNKILRQCDRADITPCPGATPGAHGLEAYADLWQAATTARLEQAGERSAISEFAFIRFAQVLGSGHMNETALLRWTPGAGP